MKLLLVMALLGTCFGLLSNIAQEKKYHTPHTCIWDKCPYKGVCLAGADSAVSYYIGDRMTDAWCIDMLHIEHPTLEYDSLETLMWQPRK